MKSTSVPSRSFILEKLNTDLGWLQRAVVAIYQKQTTSEQQAGHTIVENGQGFNGVDSEFMTSLAQRLLIHHKNLTPKQQAIARERMPKYITQLQKIAREKARNG